jgi:hypothetical protein
MAERSSGGPFRTRNLMAVVLAAGIGLGIYLGQFKGFGPGGDGGGGIGTSAPKPTRTKKEATDKFVRVVIDGQHYLLRENTGDKPVELPELIKLIQDVPGDEDGIRVRVYEMTTMRMKAEEDLKKAIAEAEIPETAVLWVPSEPAK